MKEGIRADSQFRTLIRIGMNCVHSIGMCQSVNVVLSFTSPREQMNNQPPWRKKKTHRGWKKEHGWMLEIGIRRNMSPGIENLPYGQDFRGERDLHVASLGSDLRVCMCLTESLSLGHYGQMFGRLSCGLLISKRSQDEKQSVFFPPLFFSSHHKWEKITA